MNKKYLSPTVSELIDILSKRKLTDSEVDKYYKFNASLPFAYSVALISKRNDLTNMSSNLDVYFFLKDYDFFKINNLDYKEESSKAKYKEFWINLLDLDSSKYLNSDTSNYSKELQEALYKLLVNDLEYEFKYKEDSEKAIEERRLLINKAGK